MVDVFYSHLGERPLKNINTEYETYDFEGKIIELINLINEKHPGIKNLIHDSNYNIFSSVNIYLNIEYEDYRILDGPKTVKVKNILEETIKNEDNILISIYNPNNVSKLLEDTLLEPSTKLEYVDPTRLESRELEFKNYIDDILGPVEEQVKKFHTGESTLRNLMIPLGESMEISFKGEGTIDNLFDRTKSKLIPEDLVKAIQRIWELDNLDTKLYNHQEDCLFCILSKLKDPDKISKEALLLAIPTGGGKTEAFLIPVISHIHEKKNNEIKEGHKPKNKISAIITYPTKALANDQANRIVEILYEANKNANPLNQITIGVFTGDTPKGHWDLRKTNIIQVCPNKECQSSYFEYKVEDTENGKRSIMVCRDCGVELNFLYLTRQDILNYPPDILITNLDMINYCLQSPTLRPLFQEKVDLMVFDEVHLCESVFGCHTAHLLRRLEATTGNKPLYVGVSATIGNAEELASLIFDVNKDKILYLNEKVRPYLTDI
ncbi:MAG: DEAD/DEAH box helicase, partial [Methanobacterium sp.]